MQALLRDVGSDCELFFAVRHGSELCEELCHVFNVFPSGRGRLPVGPGRERADCFEIFDGLQSHVSNFHGFAQERVSGLSLCHERDD